MCKLERIYNSQKNCYLEYGDLSYKKRKEILQKLKSVILSHENEIISALEKDLGKSEYEAYLSEISFLYQEIDHSIKNLKKWMKPKVVKTDLLMWPGTSKVYSSSYGVALIMAPWNYPFQLLLSPLVGAVSAGNRCILRPSEVAENTASIILSIFKDTFDESEVSFVGGGIEENIKLLTFDFDYIFFTGSTFVGKIVMKNAAENLTPVTLELGGKSPVFIYGDVDLDLAAKRVAWGKFYNSGQTCVAPDYVLIDKNLKEEFVKKIVFYIEQFYSKNPLSSEDYGKIINLRHFERLERIIDKDNILYGGQKDITSLKISPTLIDADFDSKSMEEEIFGPILPIISIDLKNALIKTQKSNPLALYIFTNEKNISDKIIKRIGSGGVCINDVIVHLTQKSLPFGGKGTSGMGNYHGKSSFDTFTHYKSVFQKSTMFDNSLRYPPYKGKLNLVKRFLKIVNFFS